MSVKKKTVASLLVQVKASKARISKERDKLRDLIDELESIAEDCDAAIDDLERAADAMSELL